MQIEGGSDFAQRTHAYTDLVEELLDHSREDSRELSREMALSKLESELKVLKESKSRDGG